MRAFTRDGEPAPSMTLWRCHYMKTTPGLSACRLTFIPPSTLGAASPMAHQQEGPQAPRPPTVGHLTTSSPVTGHRLPLHTSEDGQLNSDATPGTPETPEDRCAPTPSSALHDQVFFYQVYAPRVPRHCKRPLHPSRKAWALTRAWSLSIICPHAHSASFEAVSVKSKPVGLFAPPPPRPLSQTHSLISFANCPRSPGPTG